MIVGAVVSATTVKVVEVDSSVLVPSLTKKVTSESLPASDAMVIIQYKVPEPSLGILQLVPVVIVVVIVPPPMVGVPVKATEPPPSSHPTSVISPPVMDPKRLLSPTAFLNSDDEGLPAATVADTTVSKRYVWNVARLVPHEEAVSKETPVHLSVPLPIVFEVLS